MRISFTSSLWFKTLITILIGFFIWMSIVWHSFLFFLPHIPSITGFPFWQKTYLILLQNDAELRPTGGFISSFVEVTFTSGLPTSFAVRDVFSLDEEPTMKYKEPPYPMGELLKNEFYKGYSFRDANWSPDFPSAAKELTTFYQDIYPQKQVSGVIALNFSFIEDLFDLYGPIHAQGKELSKNNLFQTLQYEQNNIDRHNIESLRGRKSLLKEIMSPLLQSILWDLGRWREFSHLINHHIHEKNILFYSDSSSLENTYTERAMGGQFPLALPDKDIFAPVFSNLGGMKSDRYIQRDVQYHVRMANDGTLEQKTSLTGTYYITLSHLGVHNVPLSHEYKGYLRLYLPPHTQLKQEQKDYLIFSELGYTVVGIPLTLGVAETKHIQIDVILPEQLAQGGHYSVRPFLQPGLQNSHLSFSFTSPVDRFLSSKDKTVLVHENVATKSITYGQEQEVTIHISRDTTPPRVTLQSFLDYNKISVQFNEPLFESDCEDHSNYELIDTDIHVPDITNRPKIRMIKCSPTEAIVYTTNIRTQYGEAFRMNIRSLRDLNNNVISPNPMTVTIIQRFEKDKPSSDTQ